jgi:hypothetical protein
MKRHLLTSPDNNLTACCLYDCVVTSNPMEVTCKRCKVTAVFAKHLKRWQMSQEIEKGVMHAGADLIRELIREEVSKHLSIELTAESPGYEDYVNLDVKLSYGPDIIYSSSETLYIEK